MTWMLTGGAGYIGAHIVRCLPGRPGSRCGAGRPVHRRPGERAGRRSVRRGLGRGRRRRPGRAARARGHRCAAPGGEEGGRRVGRAAAALLGRERRRHAHPAAGLRRRGCRPGAVLLERGGLRQPSGDLRHRGDAGGADEPVRRDQAGRGVDAARPRGRPAAAVGRAALLQRGRCRRSRARRPQREQPGADDLPGARRGPRPAAVRRRLRHPRRVLHPRLHPRGGPGRGACSGCPAARQGPARRGASTSAAARA